MKLSDVMASARLEVFAEIGLLLFAAAFVLVLVSIFQRRHAEVFERARRLPLADDAAPAAAAEDDAHG